MKQGKIHKPNNIHPLKTNKEQIYQELQKALKEGTISEDQFEFELSGLYLEQ